jgi:hypothetical protein
LRKLARPAADDVAHARTRTWRYGWRIAAASRSKPGSTIRNGLKGLSLFLMPNLRAMAASAGVRRRPGGRHAAVQTFGGHGFVREYPAVNIDVALCTATPGGREWHCTDAVANHQPVPSMGSGHCPWAATTDATSRTRGAPDTARRPGIRIRALSPESDHQAEPDRCRSLFGSYRTSWWQCVTTGCTPGTRADE